MFYILLRITTYLHIIRSHDVREVKLLKKLYKKTVLNKKHT